MSPRPGQSLKRRPRVVIALSGGVDSSVAAALLVKEGYDCSAVFYELWAPAAKEGKGWENNCCSLEAYEYAKEVAGKLNIPLEAVNIADEFKKRVVDYFLAEYAAGRTPNPCVVCNSELRFGLMLERAMQTYNADFLATGHYAVRDHVDSWRAEHISKETSAHRLFLSRDDKKDQSYFLYQLSQATLGKVLFPLGDMLKSDVRAMARSMGLPTASKHDSQEICFLPKGGVPAFLREHLGDKPGKVKNTDGRVLGHTAGAHLVTLGQRRGIGSFGTAPHFVVERNTESNTVTVTSDQNDPHLWLSEMILEKPFWVSDIPDSEVTYTARGRHGQRPFDVRIEKRNGQWAVRPVGQTRLISPGQSLVILKGQEIVGGSVIGSIKSCATLPAYASALNVR
jgi:tRNA-specific 2-thiouridylase